MRIKRRGRTERGVVRHRLFMTSRVKVKAGCSYRVPPAQTSWTWSAWTGLWWGLSLEVEELREPDTHTTYKHVSFHSDRKRL